MTNAHLPPTIDPVAAARWQQRSLPIASAWLHEEVGRRMEERLQWISRAPRRWIDWYALNGGLQVHRQIARRFQGVPCDAVEASAANAHTVAIALAAPWWSPAGWRGRSAHIVTEPEQPAAQGADMIWSNMALHFSADPQQLMRAWHRALASDGYLMFSCFGPDTCKELRAIYADMGWGPPGPEFTDMHDWGDMLLHAGFAEPIMDMERIVLRYERPERLIQELRELGRNLHPARFAGLRGRSFQRRFEEAIERQSAASMGSAPAGLSLTFEIIYGHAFKAPARAAVSAETALSLGDMRELLSQGRKAGPLT
jgi:malonyl-CoA O-methyltransferase